VTDRLVRRGGSPRVAGRRTEDPQHRTTQDRSTVPEGCSPHSLLKHQRI